MSEQDPTIRMTINNEAYELTRHNTSIFTHLGEAAFYDHVFVVIPDEDDQGDGRGFYIPSGLPEYGIVAQFAVEHEFPLHLNMPEVASCDVDAIDQYYFKDLRADTSFPADWADPDTA